MATCERRPRRQVLGRDPPQVQRPLAGGTTGFVRIVALWNAVVFGVTGCEDAPGPLPATEVIDSAGVRVVTNPATEVPRISLGAEPLVDLGTVDDVGPEQFYRVSGARLLGDELVVANGGTSEVRVFGIDGAHRGSFGSSGEGPGEFGFAGRFWLLADDSLAFWDRRLRRVSVFDREGRFGRVVNFEVPVLNPDVVTISADGWIVLASDRYDFSEGEGFQMMYTDFVLVDADGAVVDTLPRQPLAEIGVLDTERGLAGSPLFGARTVRGGDGSSYWVGTGRTEEVRRYRLDGRLEMIVRWSPEDRIVDDDAAALALEDDLAEAPERVHSRIRQVHESRPVSDEFPTLGDLRPTTTGGVWIQEFERPGHQGLLEWKVFDADGVLVGTAGLPTGIRALEIGEDHLVAVEQDDLDVEHVRVYELVVGGVG